MLRNPAFYGIGDVSVSARDRAAAEIALNIARPHMHAAYGAAIGTAFQEAVEDVVAGKTSSF